MRPESNWSGSTAREAPSKGIAMNLQLPRVTEVLVGAGLIDTTFMTEAGRERGTAVHLACQYLDENDLDMDSVDPALVGYLDAYRDFRQQVAMDGSWIEMPQQDPKGLYRGTPDRILVDRPRCIYDLKSGAPQPSTALQLAAYVHMMPDEYSYGRYAVYL
jgi:hypothetical protein